MAVVLQNIEDSPSFDGMAIRDSVDFYAATCDAQGTGVISGMAVTQDTGSDMKVAVASGVVQMAGTQTTYSGAGSPFTIAAANTADRRDVVIYRVGTGVVVLAGTPCTLTTANWTRTSTVNGPVKPTITPATDVVLAEVYVAGSGGTATTVITTATNIVDKRSVVGGLDVTAGLLNGTTNVESIIRANTLDQMGAPAANLSMNSQRSTTLAPGIVATDAINAGQVAGITLPYTVSGCVWTVSSGLQCSMTAGTVMIGGILLTVAAVTNRAFTASNDTYVDFQDIGTGVAQVTYTAVPNLQTSPALANSGTVLNTNRNAVISAGAASVVSTGIFQGAIAAGTNAGTAGSTTVAAGSNTHAITATPLLVAAVTNFPTGGGYCTWTSASTGEQALLQFTGTTAGSLNGITVIAGRAAATVATGDAVAVTWPVVASDTIGNRINRNNPLGGVAGAGLFPNALTTTATGLSAPLIGSNIVAPFTVPAGPGRNVRMTFSCPNIKSSAVAGTSLALSVGTFPAGGGAITIFGSSSNQVKVTGDGDAVTLIGFGSLAAGSYYAGIVLNTTAAGTTTFSAIFLTTQLVIELI